MKLTGSVDETVSVAPVESVYVPILYDAEPLLGIEDFVIVPVFAGPSLPAGSTIFTEYPRNPSRNPEKSTEASWNVPSARTVEDPSTVFGCPAASVPVKDASTEDPFSDEAVFPDTPTDFSIWASMVAPPFTETDSGATGAVVSTVTFFAREYDAFPTASSATARTYQTPSSSWTLASVEAVVPLETMFVNASSEATSYP